MPSEEISQPEASPPRRKPRWRALLAVVSLAVFAYLGWKYSGDLDELLRVDPWYLGAIIASTFVSRVVTTEIFRQALASIGYAMPFMEAFHLLILRGYSGLIVPRSGIGTVGLYLKKRHGVRFASYTALLFPIALILCLAIGLLGLACLALLWRAGQTAIPLEFVVIFSASTILAAGALVVRLPVPDAWTGRLAHFLRGFSESWEQLSRDKSLLLRLVGLHVFSILSRVVRLQFAYWSIGIDANPIGVMVTSLLADLAFFFSVTPGGIGFREAAIAYGASLAGATIDQAIAAGVLDRLVMIVTLILLAQVSLLRIPGLRSVEAEESESQGGAV